MRKTFRVVGVCVVAGLSLMGCLDLPGTPIAPSWDVQVSAALAKTSHSVRELVSDIASLPPEVLDTLDLSQISIRFEEVVVLGDTSGDGIDDFGLTGEFFRSVSHAQFFIEAVNGTPVRLEISLSVLDQSGTVLLELPSTDAVLLLPPAPLDQDGKVGLATRAIADLSFEEGLIPFLESAESLSYSIDISFPENVTIAHVLSSDSLSIRMWGTFVSRMDP